MSVYAIQEVEYQALFQTWFQCFKVAERVWAWESVHQSYLHVVWMHYLVTLLLIQSHLLAFKSTSKQLTNWQLQLFLQMYINFQIQQSQIQQKCGLSFQCIVPKLSGTLKNPWTYQIDRVHCLTSSESSVFIAIVQYKVPTSCNSSMST